MGEKDIFWTDGLDWPTDPSALAYANHLVDAGFSDQEAIGIAEAIAAVDDKEAADIFIESLARRNGYQNPLAEGRYM